MGKTWGLYLNGSPFRSPLFCPPPFTLPAFDFPLKPANKGFLLSEDDALSIQLSDSCFQESGKKMLTGVLYLGCASAMHMRGAHFLCMGCPERPGSFTSMVRFPNRAC